MNSYVVACLVIIGLELLGLIIALALLLGPAVFSLL